MAENEFDISDIERWAGAPLGGIKLRYPVFPTDIQRWAQGNHNANPLFYDDDYAAQSRFGELVAPQSFTVAAGDGQGARPSQQGRLPNSALLFGGDEWWFFGVPIKVGDRLHLDRMLYDVKMKETKFAGPAAFVRGDTLYVNQRGEVVARQRSTSIRYSVAAKTTDASMSPAAEEPQWSDEDLERFRDAKIEYYKAIRALGLEPRRWSSIADGEALGTRLVGPHSVVSFVSEWRARPATVWGATEMVPGPSDKDSGNMGDFREQDAHVRELARIDPSLMDGAYNGAGSAHLNRAKAHKVGMPREYGYGSSIGAWILDYLQNWGGQYALVTHVNAQYRSPVLVGDVTYFNGTVVKRYDDPAFGPVVDVEVVLTNQDDAVVAKATATVAPEFGLAEDV